MGSLQIIFRIFLAYGYYFLFLATAGENIPVVGVFLPGELIVVAAGFFAAQGRFQLPLVITVACLGAMVGTIASYILGYKSGRPLIELMAAKFGVDGERIADADNYFSTHGPLTVFVGRYLTGVKAFIPALAGAHRMRFSGFVVFALLGVVSWTILAASLGFFFGANWGLLIKLIKTVGWAVLAVVGLAVIVIVRRRRASK